MKLKITQKVFDKPPQIPEGRKALECRDLDVLGYTGTIYATSPDIIRLALRYRDKDGRQRCLKIGDSDTMTEKQCRAIAKKKKAEIALGGDPQAEKQRKRDELTVDELFREHYFPYIKSQGLRSADKQEELYNNRIRRLCGNLKVTDLGKPDVARLQAGVREEGMSAAYANRHVQLIKRAYNVGNKILEVIGCKNPAVGIPLYQEESRERFLDEDELGRLMPVLMQAEKQFAVPARMIRFLLATGLRSGECRHAQWKDIRMDRKIMFIPRSRSKSKKADSIPLNAAALQVLQECDRSTPYLFANPATKKPYVSIKRSMATLMGRAGLEGVTAHVLRHTAASMLINSGHSLYSVQRLLRHSTSAVTEKYAHLSTRTIAEASDSISDQLMRAAEPKDSNVIPIDKASGEN